MAPVRKIANERCRPGYVPASSQEVCRRLGILDSREAVSMLRLRLAARQANASPSLMALVQSDAGRAWKAELLRDIELLRQEKGPQLVEVEGLPDFEKLWFEFPKAWKLLVSSCQRKLVERRQRSEPVQPAPFPVLPTFGCDECEAVYDKLRAIRSHQMTAHQRRREARRHVLDSICPVCKAGVRSRPSHSAGGGSEAVRFGVEVWSAGAVFRVRSQATVQAGETQSSGGAANAEELVLHVDRSAGVSCW